MSYIFVMIIWGIVCSAASGTILGGMLIYNRHERTMTRDRWLHALDTAERERVNREHDELARQQAIEQAAAQAKRKWPWMV